MGEQQNNLFEPGFCRLVKVQGTDRITSGASVILLREAAHRLGMIDSIAANIQDGLTEFAMQSMN